jgi:hypothetical protein
MSWSTVSHRRNMIQNSDQVPKLNDDVMRYLMASGYLDPKTLTRFRETSKDMKVLADSAFPQHYLTRNSAKNATELVAHRRKPIMGNRYLEALYTKGKIREVDVQLAYVLSSVNIHNIWMTTEQENKVIRLIERGASPDIEVFGHETLLNYFLDRFGDERHIPTEVWSIFPKLITRDSVNKHGERGFPLHTVVDYLANDIRSNFVELEEKWTHLAILMLKAGADPNRSTDQLPPALILNASKILLDKLLEYGAYDQTYNGLSTLPLFLLNTGMSGWNGGERLVNYVKALIENGFMKGHDVKLLKEMIDKNSARYDGDEPHELNEVRQTKAKLKDVIQKAANANANANANKKSQKKKHRPKSRPRPQSLKNARSVGYY